MKSQRKKNEKKPVKKKKIQGRKRMAGRIAGTGTHSETEDRLQSIIDLSTEYYWETDPHHRFTQLLGREDERDTNDRFLGRARWEIGGKPVADGGSWDAHRRTLNERLPFRDYVYSFDDPVKGRRYLSISGKPVFDPAGVFCGYHGVTHDITSEKRAVAYLQLENTIIRILAEAVEIAAALTSSIQTICQAEGWEAGSFWKFDEPSGVLRYAGGWCADDKPVFREVTEQARTVTFAPGEGLPGYVLKSGVPLCVPDVTVDPRVTDTNITRITGWRAVLLFPFHGEDRIAGVLDFYAPQIREPDERLLQIIRLLSTEISHFYQRALALERLRESEERYSSTVELAAIGIAHVALDGRFVHVNRQACRILGYTEPEFLQRTVRQISHPEDVDVTTAYREEMRAGRIDSFYCEKRYLRKDGSPIWVGLTVAARRAPDGRHLYDISVMEDISARKQAQHALRESEARFRGLTELTSDWYWEQDAEFRFTRFVGHDTAFIETLNSLFLGKRGWETDIPLAAEGGENPMKVLQEAHEPFRDVVMQGKLPDRTRRFLSVSGEPVFDATGRFKGYRGLSRDITASKEAEERIQYVATHDSLTGLPNRAMFNQLLNMAVQTARRYSRKFAVLFVDLDRFKLINDTLGHEAGDELLKEMSKRLRNCLRSSDVVARLGGDELVVLIQEINDAGQPATVARNILSAAIRPMEIRGQECRVTASIGISVYPTDAEDELSVMKNADMAMYAAKADGKNTFKFYSAEIKSQSIERLSLETNLRRALERGELSLHYQAKLDMRKQAITGVEALLRWHSPELGSVSPAQFIPLAEETGLIVSIGKWVLKAACAQNMAWQRQGLPPLYMAVNLSVGQFNDEALVDDIAAALKDTGMAAELLELEITESMVMHDSDRAIGILNAITQLGVRLAIDDFGTGYSSLAQLKRFPIDTLKIDRSFIREVPGNPEDRAITEAIIAMGKTLSLTIVAEGVETAEQQAFLHSRDCDAMQGYHLSRPVAPEQFAELLRSHQSSANL